MAAAAQQPVSPQLVANAFVQQYYHILHRSPALLPQFYQGISQIGRPSLVDDSMTITTTMEAIDEKILSQNYAEFKPEIKTVDAQSSCDNGIHVLVTGYLVGKDNVIQNFTQTFFLATQATGYFVLNDMLRYTGNGNNFTEITVSSNNVEDRSTPRRVPSPVEKNEHIAVPVNVENAIDTADNGVAVVVKKEVPVTEVVVEVPNDSLKKVVADSKVQEEPKKSYASIVMVMKANGAAISSPAPRRITPKVQGQQVNLVQPLVPAAEIPFSGQGAAEDANKQESEADRYSIYIKGLPLNATPAILDEEFKKFGSIKSGGIQVRSKQGFCFGFVEYEAATSVEKAIKASPIMIGGRQVYVQEKLSNNNSHVNNNRGGGRFQGGRMSGFRNEGPRGGRGNYGRGGGYNNNNNNNNTRGDFNGRNDFGNNNRGGSRGGFSNRGGNNNGSRENHSGEMIAAINGDGGEAKAATTPHVSATA